MSLYAIVIPRSVSKSIKNIPLPWRERVLKTIELLQFNPHYGVKMSGPLRDRRKIVVWPHRIVYKVQRPKKIIILLEVDHRKNVSYA